MEYEKVVVGIDQSYTNTGIAIVTQPVLGYPEVYDCTHFALKGKKVDFRIQFREFLKDYLKEFIVNTEFKSLIIVYERIRLFSQHSINFPYIVATAGLTACIEEVGSSLYIPVFSVDTQAWKRASVGTSAAATPPSEFKNVPAKKWPTVKWCIENGWWKEIANKDGKIDNDRADSIGIAYSVFNGVSLKRET